VTWKFQGDRMVGHDFPAVCGSGMHDFTLTEIEVGARVALALDTPEQAWWELIGFPQLRELERKEAADGGVLPSC
jgi:hypothetical protein